MVSVLGEHHVDSLRSGHALALDHRCLGDHEQALRLDRRVHGIRCEVVHGIRCEVLGDRHSDISGCVTYGTPNTLITATAWRALAS